MSALEGFFVFNFDVGVASASITPNGVTFNKAVVTKLDFPSHVLLLINEQEKQIAIKVCDESTPRAAAFYRKQGDDESARSVRWNSRDLLNSISDMMDWDLKQMGHRVDGKLIPEEKAMVFDLTKAKDLS